MTVRQSLVESKWGKFVKLALIGLMGAGKTTVGRLLAENLSFAYIDLDSSIEATTMKSVSELFAEGGESGFREKECLELGTVTAEPGSVILSTGGGIVTTTEARAILKDAWICVYLRARTETILERVGKDSTVRPLLQDRSTRTDKINELMNHRAMLYVNIASYIIDVDDRTPGQVADDISIWLKSWVKSRLES
jgi:shikimate kinase